MGCGKGCFVLRLVVVVVFNDVDGYVQQYLVYVFVCYFIEDLFGLVCVFDQMGFM